MGTCISGRQKKKEETTGRQNQFKSVAGRQSTGRSEDVAKMFKSVNAEIAEENKVLEETMETYDRYAKTGATYEMFYPKVESDRAHMKRMGYPDEHIELIPEELWNKVCGGGSSLHFQPPTEGQVIIDLGSGVGLDVILAAKLVGESGKVYGIDLSDAMIEVAAKNCENADIKNVEFISARIDKVLDTDHLLGQADRVMSNGVFNLCKDKDQCYINAFNLLKEGGMFIFNDLTILPEGWHLDEGALEEVSSGSSWADWVQGCIDIAETKDRLASVGFINVSLDGWTEIYSSLATRGAIFSAQKPKAPSSGFE